VLSDATLCRLRAKENNNVPSVSSNKARVVITDGWSRQQSQATSNPVSTGLIDQVLTTLSALYRAFDKYVAVKKGKLMRES